MNAAPHKRTAPPGEGSAAQQSGETTTAKVTGQPVIERCVECDMPALSADIYYCRWHATDERFLTQSWPSVEHMWAHMMAWAEDEAAVMRTAEDLLPDTDDWEDRAQRICTLAFELEQRLDEGRARGLMARAGALGSVLLNRSQLAQLPAPSPLIADTLDLRTTALLAGHFGSLKSFLALDWSACIATGKPWQGRQVEQGRVVYLAAEGAYGLHKRLAAWEYAWGRTIDPEQLLVLPQPVNMGRPEQVGQLLTAVEALRPKLLVIDTVARCAVGFDENSSKDMGVFVDAMDRLKVAMDGGTVLGVHHTGKDRKTVRGSSALEDGVDTVYLSEGDAGLVKLERTKRKDGPTLDVHQLKLEVVEHAGSGVISSTRGSETVGSARTLLDAMESHFSLTGATTSQLREVVEQMPKATFHRARNVLLQQGLIANHGTEARPRYVLVRGGADDE